MSCNYDLYLEEHRSNVAKAFEWFENNIANDGLLLVGSPVYTINLSEKAKWLCTYSHDNSKYDAEEYDAYDTYFYGNNKSFKVVEDFKKAWLHHIHANPHHWQHWILVNDEPNEGTVALPMPDEYIIEMICDWWAFSHKSGNLYGIFDWYDKHKSNMVLHKSTRKTVEDILDAIRNKLNSNKN